MRNCKDLTAFYALIVKSQSIFITYVEEEFEIFFIFSCSIILNNAESA